MAQELRDNRTPILAIHQVYDDFGLTIEAFRVLCHLSRRAGTDGYIFPSYASIGKVCFRGSYPNASVSTLKAKAIAAIKELISAGLISKKSQSIGNEQTANRYFLNHSDQWVNNFTPDAESPNVRKGRAKGLKRANANPVNPKDHPVNRTNHTPQSSPLTPPVNPRTHPVNGALPEEVQTKDLQNEEVQFKTPLTPQGGNGAIASEISQNSESRSEQTEDQQNPTVKKEDQQSGGKRAGKGSARAAKRRRTRQEIADEVLVELPAAQVEAFNNFFAWYQKEAGKAGKETPSSYAESAIAWKDLLDSNYRGHGYEAFRKGCAAFQAQARASNGRMPGVPDAERFLYPKARATAKWEDYLGQSEPVGNANGFLPNTGSDRGHSPPVRTAEDFAFPEASKPPAFIKEQIRQMKGAAACA